MAPVPPLRDYAADRHLLPQTLTLLRQEMADYHIPKSFEPVFKQHIAAERHSNRAALKLYVLIHKEPERKKSTSVILRSEHFAITEVIETYNKLHTAGKTGTQILAILDKDTDLKITAAQKFDYVFHKAETSIKKPSSYDLMDQKRPINREYDAKRSDLMANAAKYSGLILNVHKQEYLSDQFKKLAITDPNEQKAIRRYIEALSARDYSYELFNSRAAGIDDAIEQKSVESAIEQAFKKHAAYIKEKRSPLDIIKALTTETEAHTQTIRKLNEAGNAFDDKLSTAKTDKDKAAARKALSDTLKAIKSTETNTKTSAITPPLSTEMAAAFEQALDPAHRVHLSREDNPISNKVRRDPGLKSLSI